MEKLLKILMWLIVVLTTVVLTMIVIGLLYNIPEQSLYSDIFKGIMVFWVVGICITGIVLFYVEMKN